MILPNCRTEHLEEYNFIEPVTAKILIEKKLCLNDD